MTALRMPYEYGLACEAWKVKRMKMMNESMTPPLSPPTSQGGSVSETVQDLGGGRQQRRTVFTLQDMMKARW